MMTIIAFIFLLSFWVACMGIPSQSQITDHSSCPVYPPPPPYFLPCLCRFRFRDSEFKIQQHLHLDPIKRALPPNAQAQAQAQVLLPRPPNPRLKVIPAKASKCQSTSPILKATKHPVASTTYTNRQCCAKIFSAKTTSTRVWQLGRLKVWLGGRSLSILCILLSLHYH